MVSASFTYDRAEYLRGFRRYRIASLGSKRDLLLGIAAIVGGVYFYFAGYAFVAAVLLLAGIVLTTMVVFAVVVQPILVYNAHPKLKDRYSLTFSDTGISFHTDEIDADVKWSMYSGWIQDNEFFTLFYDQREMLIVPKRALAQGDDSRLQSLLSQYVGRALQTTGNHRLQRSGGGGRFDKG
ncbi:YcxB family protein [Crateriforma conspicua]|uniref:YcxB-like C-terminal domain-containing protein n=1 Tax=Crateriforma conspicua TaxID=2527996 RepID=A0A5C5XPW7_9PLAN|nr:YcxB family protein [Crateriforma conspicua]QDV61090.1 hypothetical protein Mal65_02130 [Crateriforma conspicua]TWT64924.1 hypothetical protein Pan14r_54670 [Crateriforma conspicua]